MNLDRHREGLVKYCYDMSKVVFAVAVLNPAVTKGLVFIEFVVGLGATILLLSLAILLEKDIQP
jgi:hypothetical protein